MTGKKSRKIGAGIGYFLLSCTPLLIFLGIQIVAAFLVVFYLSGIMMIPYLMGDQQVVSFELMMRQVEEQYMDNILYCSLIAQVMAFAVFVLWYYLTWSTKKQHNPFKIFRRKSVGGIILLGVSFEFVISSILSIIDIYFPHLMDNYKELMEEAGMDEISVAVALATIIMAPIVEELIFRGITLKLAMKINGSFWVANILQALLFGIAHMNWVQGSYAFCLGIVMGYVVKKYKTLYASIMLHAVFNFAGTILVALVSLIPGAESLAVNLLLIVAFGILSMVSVHTIQTDVEVTEI